MSKIELDIRVGLIVFLVGGVKVGFARSVARYFLDFRQSLNWQ